MANIIEVIIKGSDRTGNAFGAVDTKLGRLGAAATKFGGLMSVGVTLPLLSAGIASISAASDFKESLSKSNILFEDNAAAIEKWSESSVDNLGLSQESALSAAATFGSLFIAMGAGADETAEMSQNLVQIAADLGSFNDMSTEEALEKLRSGMLGSSEAVAVLGINLKAGAVMSKAIELGLVDANGEISEANLLTARYAVIMEDSSLAAGDFAATSQGMSGQMKKLSAELGNLSKAAGDVFLPLATKLVTIMVEWLSAFNDLSPESQKIIIGLLGLAVVVGPLVLVFGKLVTIVNAVSILFGSGGALATAGPVIAAAFGAITLPIAALIVLLGALAAAIVIYGEDAVATVETIIWGVTTILSQAIADFKIKWASDWAAISDILSDIDWLSLGTGIINGIISGITGGTGLLMEAARDAAEAAFDAAAEKLGIKSPSVLFEGLGRNIMAGMGQGIAAGTSDPVSALGSAIPQLTAAAAGAAAGNTFNMNVGDGLDVEQVAFRVAEIIHRRSG